jgi:hypothetical protein
LPELLNLTTGAYEPAELFSPIEAADLDNYRTHWLPPMNQRIEELKQAGQFTRQGLAEHNLEDFHWKWPRKCQERMTLEWNSFALRCGGNTQGLMFVNMLRHCRNASQLNQHMVYIDLISTAPWNRPRLSPARLYRGVGLILFTEAVLLSQTEGFDGRLGLHGLPGATAFYEQQCSMDNLGPDPSYDNLPYLELTAEQARRFLGQ